MIVNVATDATAAIIMTFFLSSFFLVFDFLLFVVAEGRVVLIFVDGSVIVGNVVVVLLDVLGLCVNGANALSGLEETNNSFGFVYSVSNIANFSFAAHSW